MAFCSDCGKKIKEDAKFCPKCGTKQTNEKKGKNKQKEEPKVVERVIEKEIHYKKSKGSKFLKFIIIIVILGAIVGGIIFLVVLNEASENVAVRSTDRGISITSKETKTFTETCSRCSTSNDCDWATDEYCKQQGWKGSERVSGYDTEKYLGLKNEVTCTFTCYRY